MAMVVWPASVMVGPSTVVLPSTAQSPPAVRVRVPGPARFSVAAVEVAVYRAPDMLRVPSICKVPVTARGPGEVDVAAVEVPVNTRLPVMARPPPLSMVPAAAAVESWTGTCSASAGMHT